MTPARPEPAIELSGPRVVALGGGHGLSASLTALRTVTGRLTAVVGVSDDGGSSGRLREEMGVLPPGDLRMALAALCGDDEWGRTWSRVVQHRYRSEGDLHDHAVGNLLITALWELLDDPVAGLDWMARLLGVQGRVLPASTTPLEIVARVEGADGTVTEVRGQVAAATTAGRVLEVHVEPAGPAACEDAVTAVLAADWVVLGPGSWFTSVLPHLLVPDLARALTETTARRVLTLNLQAQPGETSGFSPEQHLEVLARHAPDLRLDAVIADAGSVPDVDSLRSAAGALGAELVLAEVAVADGTPRHDPVRLATAYNQLFGRGSIPAWR